MNQNLSSKLEKDETRAETNQRNRSCECSHCKRPCPLPLGTLRGQLWLELMQKEVL